MFGNNVVHLTGNLGRDPEIRYFESGKSKASFSLAVSAGKDRPSIWVNCECWNRTAERVRRRGHKGIRVAIAGSLKQDSWIDKATGKSRSQLLVNVENIDFIAPAPRYQPSSQPQPVAAIASPSPSPSPADDDHIPF